MVDKRLIERLSLRRRCHKSQVPAPRDMRSLISPRLGREPACSSPVISTLYMLEDFKNGSGSRQWFLAVARNQQLPGREPVQIKTSTKYSSTQAPSEQSWLGRQEGGRPRITHRCDWPACCVSAWTAHFLRPEHPQTSRGSPLSMGVFGIHPATRSCLLRRLPPATRQVFIPNTAHLCLPLRIFFLLPTVINLQPSFIIKPLSPKQ